MKMGNQYDTKHLDETEVAAFFSYFRGQPAEALRDFAMFYLMLGAGLRTMEVAALDLGQVINPRTLEVPRWIQLRVFKGSQSENGTKAPQEVVLPEDLRAVIAKFVEHKKAEREPVGMEAPLFVTRRGDGHPCLRIGERGICWAFDKHRAALVEKGLWRPRITAHWLRHTYLYRVQRACGGDAFVTARAGRHADLRSTRVYAGPNRDDMVRVTKLVGQELLGGQRVRLGVRSSL